MKPNPAFRHARRRGGPRLLQVHGAFFDVEDEPAFFSEMVANRRLVI
jgi:hypothetical protein